MNEQRCLLCGGLIAFDELVIRLERGCRGNVFNEVAHLHCVATRAPKPGDRIPPRLMP